MECSKLLLECAADPDTTTLDGKWTLLKMASSYAVVLATHAAIADLLKQHGTKVYCINFFLNPRKSLPYHPQSHHCGTQQHLLPSPRNTSLALSPQALFVFLFFGAIKSRNSTYSKSNVSPPQTPDVAVEGVWRLFHRANGGCAHYFYSMWRSLGT